jgi:3-oxoacid CoA-transferase B subunit
MSDSARLIARRAAAHVQPGEIVNLGIGIPTHVADHLDGSSGVVLQTENGMLGVGPTPRTGEEDPTLVNAGKLPVSELAGASYFSSSESFAMIRGGHVDLAILGALQVDESGRIANWTVPGRPILGVGGAMDLLAGARRVLVATTHLTKAGEPKIVATCTLPLSGDRTVDIVVTEHATFEVDEHGLTLTEVAAGTGVDWVRRNTGAAFRLADGLTARARGAAA